MHHLQGRDDSNDNNVLDISNQSSLFNNFL